MNWFQLFALAITLGEDAMAAQAEIVADQPVVSPPAIVTIDGHKYAATLHLDPVAG